MFGGLYDKFPMLMNKGLPPLEPIAAGELKTDHLMTHPVSLDEGPKSDDMFKHKNDGCVRAVLRP